MAKRQRRQLVKAKEGYPPGEVGLLAVVTYLAQLDGDTEAAEDLKELLHAVVSNDTGPGRSGPRAVQRW